MAGRGGYKPTTSLRPEQLQGMGITGKEMQSATVTLPPTFPPLINRTAMPEITEDREYIIAWKDKFQAYLKNSPYYSNSDKVGSSYYQRYYLENTRSERKFGSFAWDHMPAELKPNFKRKLTTKNGQAKVAKLVNVEETFKALIQKEASGNKKLDMTREDQKDSDDEDEPIEDDEHDDEMDEDNDYGNNYFDNGEENNDDDDNLDDGPIY